MLIANYINSIQGNWEKLKEEIDNQANLVEKQFQPHAPLLAYLEA